MYNRRYEKVFLMLRQETAGYALGKRPPWGSCVMEIKNGQGRLHLTVQGLRKGNYGVYAMLGENPAETLFCGELLPDGREGRGEVKWDFSPDALGHGKKAEDFRAVILLAEEGKNGTFSAPLTAFFGEKKEWKREFSPKRPQRKPEKTPEISLQAAEAVLSLPVRPRAEKEKRAAEQPQRAEQPKVEPVKAAQESARLQDIAEEQKESIHGNFSGLLAKFRRELEDLEETGVLTPEEAAKIRGIGAADAKAEQTEAVVQTVAQEPSDTTEIPPEFAENKELQPFDDGVSWKCLALEELTLLPQLPLKWQKDFFFLLSYRRYHHLVLRAEGGSLWLGLPCVYHAEDEERAREFGFETFRSVDGTLGYWLAKVEPAEAEK